jgi:hypothetical protein
VSGRGFTALLALLFVVYTSLAGNLPPIDDELYYWCWSKELQLSYYDHPPMVALMIRASTMAFGDTLFAIRFPACVATVAVFGVIGWLTRPRGILFGTVFTPLFTFGAIVVTPDTPLLLFWALYLAWLVLAHQRLTPTNGSAARPVPVWHWAFGGMLLGCGILGKYTTGLAVPAGLLSFLLLGFGGVRAWVKGYALHLLVAFAVSAPILIHNIQHDFIPLLYQWKHAATSSRPGLRSMGEFLGVQVLLNGTLPIVLLPWVAWKFRTLIAEPRLRVCFCLYALPLLFFTAKSTRGPLEGNWALVSFLAFWPIAAFWYGGLDQLGWQARWFWKWGGRLSFVIPGVCVAALGTHLVYPLSFVHPDDDRVTRATSRDKLFAEFAECWKKLPNAPPVFTDSYQHTALLRFHGVNAYQESGISRPSQFTQVPSLMAKHPEVYYFSNGLLEAKTDQNGLAGTFADHVASFERGQILAEFPLMIRGERCDSYKLVFYHKPIDPDRPPPARSDRVISTRP